MSAISEIRLHAQPELHHYQNAPRNTVVGRDIGVNCTAVHQPMSLQPGEEITFGCVLGDEECCAIRDSWRASIPVVVLSPPDFEELADRNSMVFTPGVGDLRKGK